MNILEARRRLLEGGVKKRTAAGNPIVVRSLARMYPGLNIYGWSKQDGTPSPDNPVPIVSAGDSGEINVRIAGAQLFDFENADIVNMYIANSGIGEFPQNWSVVVPISPNTIYTISEKNKNTIRAALLSEYPYDGIQALYKVTISQYDNIVIPFGYEANYLMIQLYGNFMDKPDFSGIMINYGSVALPYEHYEQPQTLTLSTPGGLPGIPVSSGGNYTDADGQQWVCDEIDLARGKYVQRVAIEQKKGDFRMTESADVPGRYYHPGVLDTFFKNGSHEAFCNIASWASWGLDNIHTSTNWLFALNGSSYYISPPSESGIESAEELNNLLNSLEFPVVFVGQLVTPIETDLSAEQIAAYKALHTYSPTTTVSNDADAWMKVGYKTRKSLEVTT